MTEATTTSRLVDELASRFWEGYLEREPIYATLLGDERYDDRLPDPGPAGRAAQEAAYRDVLRTAQGIERDGLALEDEITLDMLTVVAHIGLAQLEHRLHELLAVDQLAGAQALPGDLARLQRADSPERFERLLARLAAYPAFLSACQDNMADAVASGLTAARSVVERTIEQTRRFVEAPADESPLMRALPLSEADRERLREALERHVRPAQARYLEALERYLPHARPADGLWSVPDGEAIYRTLVLASTTLEADPRELHEYGLAQIESIGEEREAVARKLGHADAAALRRALDADPANHATEPAAIVALAEAQIERAMAEAPRWFGRQPRATCQVRAVEPYQEQEAPPAFYYPPAMDGSRGGIYYVNTYQPADRPLHQLAARTFHEAIPGHHFQIAIESELEGLPPFRRLGSRLVGVAYPEGWGLYVERLADEMGLYETDHERLGMLDAQAWRAARLVIDTGIHAFGWDRQRSIELLVSIGLSPLEAETETDRYIAWPAQALSYMVGQRELNALRAEAAQRHGPAFDLRAFHDSVLGHGALPLATLRRELPAWLERGGA
ncbi:MAG TPA: DUF885 domain-containing protein [Candidatus Limnocylindrales bacterium]|nr:DUF885 domain-containing protein [Candidatus Limnocylindrales bacterium]